MTASLVFNIATTAITVAAIAWSFRNSVLPGLRLRG